MTEPGPWLGLSLAFIRQVTNQPARYVSCREAITALDGDIQQDDLTPLGAYVWYATTTHDNVALAIGNQYVLAVHPQHGWPMLTFEKDPRLGQRIGWTRRMEPER
jgi:hypothetical protein